MTQTVIRRSALLLTSALLVALLLAFALILSGPRLAQAQDRPSTDTAPAGAITGLTDNAPLASECFVNYDGGNDTDFDSADHTAVQNAVDAAAPGSTIRIAGTCAGVSSRAGTTETVYISKSLTLEGGFDQNNWAAGSNPGTNPTILDAKGGEHVVYVTADASSVMLSALIIQGGGGADTGGGINNKGGLTVVNSLVRDNSSDDSGGGIYNADDSTLWVSDSTVSGNTTAFTGGGIHSQGTLSITNSSIISDNVAGTSNGWGGGIYATGPAAITDSDLISNTAKGGEGGGIYASGARLDLVRSTINSNTANSGGGIGGSNGASIIVDNSHIVTNTAANGVGGGIRADDSAKVTFQNSQVRGNQASSSGGGIHISAGAELTLSLSAVVSNTAQTGPGGGIYSIGSQTMVSGSDLFSNTAKLSEGGGIFDSSSRLELADSTVKGNTATSGGGVSSSGGALTVTHSTIVDNTANDNFGGGLRAQSGAKVSIRDSQIEGNQAWQSGGGIHVLGGTQLTLSHSAIVSNTAQTIRGGGVYVRDRSSALIENSTISGNRAAGVQGAGSDQGNGGGIYLGGGSEGPSVLTVTQSTVAHNYAAGSGGGMDYNLADLGDILTFRGTILAGNQAGVSHPDCTDYDTSSYTFANNANNLFSGAAGDDCPVGANDLSIQALGLTIDDVLAPLAKNGGPTLNHALLPDGPAIDAGNNLSAVDAEGSPLATDQRGAGFPRIRLGTVDIGAYEYGDCTLPATVGDEDELDGAILCYNDQSAPGTYTITLGADIDLSGSPVAIDNGTEGVSLFLDGAGRAVDGQDTPGIQPFAVLISTTVHMDDITITGGHEVYDATQTITAGGLANAGDLTLTNSRVTGNRGLWGGGVRNYGSGRLAIVDSQITDNRASENGGGVYDTEGIVTLTGSTIYSNTAAFSGGGIYVEDYASLTLSHSAVVSNTAETQRGGGIYIRHGTRAVIENSTISGNRSEGQDGTQNDQGNGGGIYVGFETPNQVTVTHSTIVDNYAAGEGGGMDFNRGTTGDVLTFRATILAGNRAGGAYQDCYDYNTSNYTFNSDAYNLFSGATGDDCPVGPSDLSLQALGLTIDDVLNSTLAKNGGETLNHALLLGSEAQDAVPAASCTLPDDQRGIVRPQGDDCDIGAYELDYYPLAVIAAGTGSGTVSSDLAGINCQPGGTDCSANYADGVLVALTATPAVGSTFGGWSGACTGNAACTVTMDQAQNVTATFDSTSSRIYLPYITKD